MTCVDLYPLLSCQALAQMDPVALPIRNPTAWSTALVESIGFYSTARAPAATVHVSEVVFVASSSELVTEEISQVI